MKSLLKILGVLILLISGYVLYVFATTGYFRKIENTYPAEGSISNYLIPGVEDIAISREDEFLILSSDDRAGRRDGHEYKSGLYYMDLRPKDEHFGAVKSLHFLQLDEGIQLYPHGISLIKLDSNIHRLLVVNHVSQSSDPLGSSDLNTRHTIEEFILSGRKLTHVKTHEGPDIVSPNDVAAVGPKSFYFSNDHTSTSSLGLLAEDYLGVKKANVVYYDGANYKVVADGIGYANGVCHDPARNLLYVAAPREFATKAYRINTDDGSLTLEANMDCSSGVDNIELDENGKLWIGSHPNLLTFAAYAKGDKEYSPSEIITIDYKSKDDYKIESLYLSDGRDMSGSTTAVPHKGQIYIGNVMDNHFVALDRSIIE